MKILFVHQNFPGQFKHLASALLEEQGNEVVAFTMNAYSSKERLRVVRYKAARGTTAGVHPWVAETETKVIRGDAAYRAALILRDEGYIPDVIYAHPGWGESLFLKQIWPESKLIIYCEFHYRSKGSDATFDPEFLNREVGDECRIQMKNFCNYMHFDMADAGISPTEFQKNVFPEPFRSKISVVHDGIDTDVLRPDPNVCVQLGSLRLTQHDEVVTFVSRNLEPHRGYHVFMRALPELLARRPNLRVIMVGGDGVSYGAKPPIEKSWKDIFLDEVKDRLDMQRVHFVGQVQYKYFVQLLQLSTVHVYLTYPFVLSWSLLEAMSCGCAIVASNTLPVREAIQHDETGLLTDFFDTENLVLQIEKLLLEPQLRSRLSKNARRHAIRNYDLKRVCLPAIQQLIKTVTR